VYASENELPTVSSVTVTPETATVEKGATQQFIAAVSGTNNPTQTVTWTVEGGGNGTSISTDGLLSVAANESAPSLTVKATSTIDTSKSGTASVTISSGGQTPTITSVTITPETTTVAKGANRKFTAAVSGTNNPAQTVTWTVEGGGNGTSISIDGLLSVAANESASSLTVKATSTIDTSKFGTASVTVEGEVINDIASVQGYLSAASGGATATAPVFLTVQLNLDTSGNWASLLGAIGTVDKFVALDLSTSTISGTEYDPLTTNFGESKIVSLVLPNAATSIKAGSSFAPTFQNFTALTSVSGSAVETIGDYAFSGCDALTMVSLPTATDIGDYAFSDCATLTMVSLPTATSIGDSAFSGCYALTTVSLPAATSIGDSAFYNCAALSMVSLPAATSIGDDAFSSCDALSTLNLPAATDIGNDAFSGCDAIKTLSLGLTSISKEAFSGWESLTEVSLPAATSIGDSAFSGTNLTTVSLPVATDIGDSAFSGTKLTKLTEVSLPVATDIGSTAFRDCAALTTVSLPVATSIGGSAFSGCTALTTVSLPVATDISVAAFFGCTKLTEVSLPVATDIGDSAFRDCAALTTVSLPMVTDIGAYAFSNTGGNAITVTLGSTAPRLGSEMFLNVKDTKTVTIKVPSNATGYELSPMDTNTVCWGNGFLGKGWNGLGFVSSSGDINGRITLTIEEAE
jgi:hypothetical protein